MQHKTRSLPRTQQALIRTITRMLDSGQDLSQITIMAVCQEAQVSRPTFYQYFCDTNDLAHAAALSRLHDAFDAIPQAALGDSWPTFVHDTFHGLLSDLKKHAHFYNAVLDRGGMNLAEDLISFLTHRFLDESPLGPILRRQSQQTPAHSHAQFLAAGTFWQVKTWLRSDFTGEDSIEDMVTRLTSLILASSGATDAERAKVRNRHSSAPEPSIH